MLPKLNPGLVPPGRRRALERTAQAYRQDVSPGEIEVQQLRSLNAVWQEAVARLSFYRYWLRKYQLPVTFTSLSQLNDLPMLTKAVIKEHDGLIFAESRRATTYSTGGSTAEPTHFPRGGFERAEQYADNYVGRTWWGISPTDSSGLVWGHSHLYGDGWTRRMRRADRVVRDGLTNTLRLDGYRISEGDSRRFVADIIRYRPTHLVGYTSALLRIAQVADPEDLRQLAQLKLRGVITAAETVAPSEAKVLSRTFACPTIIEYGAAELGVMAVSRQSTWNIRVLWRSHVIMPGAENGVAVTTLKRRQFPLINYTPGDTVTVSEQTPSGSAVTLSSIEGRVLDVLKIDTATGNSLSISALQLTHVLKGHDAVRAVQFRQIAVGTVAIHLDIASDEQLGAVVDFFWRVMDREYPDAQRSSIVFKIDRDQQRTTAGKHRVMRVSE